MIKRFGIILCLLLVVAMGGIQAEKLTGSVDSSESENINIYASIVETKPAEYPLEHIAQALTREFEKMSEKHPQRIKLFINNDSVGTFAANQIYTPYKVEIEILRMRWEIQRRFQIPLIFFMYCNNYNIEVICRIYRYGETEPAKLRNILVSNTGAQVYQLFENNPHDGGLVIAHGRQVTLENETEDKLAKTISKELYKEIVKQGG